MSLWPKKRILASSLGLSPASKPPIFLGLGGPAPSRETHDFRELMGLEAYSWAVFNGEELWVEVYHFPESRQRDPVCIGVIRGSGQPYCKPGYWIEGEPSFKDRWEYRYYQVMPKPAGRDLESQGGDKP